MYMSIYILFKGAPRYQRECRSIPPMYVTSPTKLFSMP